MIDPNKASPPQAAADSLVSARVTVAPSQAWGTSGNGEQGFAAWLSGQAEPARPAPAAAAPAPQPVPAPQMSAPQASSAPAATDPGALADRAPATSAASSPPSGYRLAAGPPASPPRHPAAASSASSAVPATSAPGPAAAAAAPSVPAASPAAPAASAYSSGNGEARFEPVVAGNTAANKGHVHAFAEGDQPTVWDLLDFINPLQHIPVVNLVYRELTGDKIGALPQIVGGALLGGPVGALSAIVNVAVEESTGKDIGGQVMAMLNGDSGGSAAEPQTRLAEAPATPAAAAPAAPPAERPRGRIDVIAPTPSDAAPADPAASGASAVSQAAPSEPAATGEQVQTAAAPATPTTPATPAPAESREAVEARKRAASLKMPIRATPTRPVTASALERLSPDSVKPAAPSRAVHAPPAPTTATAGAAEQDGGANPEALPTPGTPTRPRRALSASDSVQPQAEPGNTADFVGKFMAAMDKYDKASRLTSVQPAAAKKQAD